MEIWSFFSGGMGLDIGLHQAGLKTTLAVEKDKWSCNTIRTNMPELDLLEADVRDLSADNLLRTRNISGQVFLMVGGPPCQSFSPGGKRAGLLDPRGNLIYEYFRLINEVRPQYFVLENVANLVTAALKHRPIDERPGKKWNLKNYKYNNKKVDNCVAEPLREEEQSGSAIKQLIKSIKGLGYTFRFGILNAADFGAPQNRLRFIMIGCLGESALYFPKPTHGGLSSNTHCTLRNSIYDLKENPGPHSNYTPETARYFELVPPGGNWRDIPSELQQEAMGGAYHSGGGKTGFYRRLCWDALSPTLTGTPNRKGSALCHPEATRPLSVAECARIQGFPDSWEFLGSMSRQYLQIGNAVPIPLGKAIGKSILRSADQPPPNINMDDTELSIDFMLETATKRLQASARNKRTKRSTTQLSLFD